MNFIALCEKIVEMLRERALLHMDFYSYLSGNMEERIILKELERNSNAKLIFRDSDAFMPVIIEGEMIGAFVMKEAHKQSGYTIDRIQKMIDKVITICTAGGGEKIAEALEESQEMHPAMFFSSGTYLDQHKAAVAAHESSKRFAFLSSQSIGRDNFESVESIEKIGPITVWIENVSDFNVTEQEAIASYVAKHTDAQDDLPFLIMSSRQPLSELMAAQKLSENLRKVLLAQTCAVGVVKPQDTNSNVISFSQLKEMRTSRASGASQLH